MPCISIGNDPPQSVDFKRSKDVADFLVLIDGIVDLAADEDAGLVQERGNQAGAGPLQSSDDESSALLTRLPIDNEALV